MCNVGKVTLSVLYVERAEMAKPRGRSWSVIGALLVLLALGSDGGGEQPVCSVEKNQFSSSKDETTKQDIDLEIKHFLKTSHIL